MTNFSHTSCREKQYYLYAITFSRNSCPLWDNVEKCCTAEQCTYDNMIRYMCTACWISRGIDTHLGEVYLLLFHNNNGCTKAPQCYISRTLPVLLTLSNISPCFRNLRQREWEKHSLPNIWNLPSSETIIIISLYSFLLLTPRILTFIQLHIKAVSAPLRTYCDRSEDQPVSSVYGNGGLLLWKLPVKSVDFYNVTTNGK
jgi:hypothetical protein